MTTQVPLPTGSYVSNDPRSSGKRLVNCLSEINAQTSSADSKSAVPPITIRRGPGTTAFASVLQLAPLDLIMTAGQNGTTSIAMTTGQNPELPGLVTFNILAGINSIGDVTGYCNGAPGTFLHGTLTPTIGTLNSGGGTHGATLCSFLDATSTNVVFLEVSCASTLLQSFFTSISFTDSNSHLYTLDSSAASFSQETGNVYRWTWNGLSPAVAIANGENVTVTVVGGGGANTPIGFDDGTTDAVTPYGSVASSTLSVGTLNAFFTSNTTNNDVTLIVSGASSAPAKNSILNVTYTGNRGPVTLATSASSYSTSGKVSTWVWANEPAGSPAPDFNDTTLYDVVFEYTGGTAIGYDDGTTDMVTPYGSMSATALGDVGTLNAFFTSDTTGNDITLIVTGAISAPLQDALTSITYTGNRGAITLLASAASYTTNMAVATWVWDNEPSGGADPDFDAGGIYTLAFAAPSFFGTEPADLPVRGMHTMAGTTYVVIGPSLYTLAASVSEPPEDAVGTLTFIATGILGSGFVRMDDNTACLVILIPGTNIAYTYTIPSTFTFDISSETDGTDALGRSGFGSSEVGAAVSPALNTAFGSQITTSNFGTVVAFYWRYTGSQTQIVYAVDGGAGEVAPPQNSFVAISYTDANGDSVDLSSAAAVYSTSGSISIWTWITSGAPADGILTESFVVTAAVDIHHAERFGYGNTTNGSLASPSIATTFGSVAVATLFGTVAEMAWYYNGTDTTIQFIAKGASSAPLQTAFTSLQYTDANKAGVFLTSASASYTTSGDYASWVWTVAGIADGIMTPGDGYTVYVATGEQFAFSSPSPNGFQQLLAPTFAQYGAIDLGFVDGYIVFLELSGRGFYNDDGQEVSGSGQITFNTAAVFPREFGTDLLAGMVVDHRIVWMLGVLTSEGYYNAGNPVGSPFSSAPDTFMQIGVHPLAGYTVMKQDQSVFWIAQDKTVRRLNGQTPVRVSNSGIEAILENADLTGCYGMVPSIGGHPWYIVNIPAEQRSIAFDCLTTEWWEPESIITGGMWRPLCWYNALGMQLVGDGITSQVGFLDTTTYTEFGDPQYMSWTTQSIFDADNRIIHRRFEVVLTTGYAPTLTQTPLATLWVSDDSGVTWYARETKPLGERGQRNFRVYWTNLGQSRNRVYRVQLSDPTPSYTVQMFAELEGGKW